MAKKKYAKTKKPADSRSFPQGVTAVWIYLMFTLFPLILHDQYFDVLETKTKTFSYLTVTMIVLVTGWGIFSGEFARELKKEDKFGLSATDLFMLFFWVVAGVSTMTAGKYMKQAFTGEEGRMVGFAFITTITAAYFLVTRYLKFSKHMITAFLCTSWIMCLYGITDFYNMNLLHFKDHMKDYQYPIFTSFIGNINSYTIFAGLAVAVSTVLFVMSRESVKRTAFYFATMLVTLTGLTMGSSDNGYLTLAALFGLLPLAAFRTRTGLRRYILVLAVYFTNIARIWRIEQVRTAKGLDFIWIDGLFSHIAKLSIFPALIAGLWILYAALLARDVKTGKIKNKDESLPAAFRYVWLALIILIAAAAVMTVVKVNAGTKKEALEKFGPIGSYLFFDDEWGTLRGYVWRACLEEYSDLDAFHKLFGVGPDCFSVQMLLHRYKEMKDTTGQIYDSAHNEFLQYLYTVGSLGLAAYLGQLISTVVTMFKEALKLGKGEGAREPYYAAYLWASGFAVICYAAQSVVNINIPVVSPLLWIFMMFTEILARENRK